MSVDGILTSAMLGRLGITCRVACATAVRIRWISRYRAPPPGGYPVHGRGRRRPLPGGGLRVRASCMVHHARLSSGLMPGAEMSVSGQVTAWKVQESEQSVHCATDRIE